jgi:hypothetical protein
LGAPTDVETRAHCGGVPARGAILEPSCAHSGGRRAPRAQTAEAYVPGGRPHACRRLESRLRGLICGCPAASRMPNAKAILAPRHASWTRDQTILQRGCP